MLRTNGVFKLDRIIPYTILVLALMFDQAMLAPTQPLIADDTWHYKWASDILAQKPIYWFGCDANRIFPDLLFSIVAGVMPDGQSFQFWLINYFIVSAFSLGISLIFLSYALYSDNLRRMAFVAICCTFFAIITTFIPFWSFGVTAPGIHGGKPIGSHRIDCTFYFYCQFRTNAFGSCGNTNGNFGLARHVE